MASLGKKLGFHRLISDFSNNQFWNIAISDRSRRVKSILKANQICMEQPFDIKCPGGRKL